MDNVALFDLDGTLADYEKALNAALESIQSPGEPSVAYIPDDAPQYLLNRKQLILGQPGFWKKLECFQLGFDVLEIAKEIGFRIHILTAGPKRHPLAWQEKFKWVRCNLGEDVDVTITRDKSLVYGKVLVDDYPGYVSGWLANRPRGLVIMPANSRNVDFKHPQVIRYDGTNLTKVRAAMKYVYERQPRQPLEMESHGFCGLANV